LLFHGLVVDLERVGQDHAVGVQRPLARHELVAHILQDAEAEVALVAPASVRRAAALLTENALEFTTEKDYVRLRDRFIDLAQAEIDTGN
jgi:hypothetical protein